MKTYRGQFKDNNNDTVYVDIMPTKTASEGEQTIIFDFDEPVIIECNSEAIFSPVKTKSATIKIFTDKIHWDLYAPSATGCYVHIYREDITLFAGFLTPCAYTQDYAYKGVIELECVDFLSVLKQYDYKTKNPNEKGIISVAELLDYVFADIPNVPQNHIINCTDFDINNYYLQEANFFDDDDEPMKRMEVLQELFTYLGFSAVQHGEKIYIVDYNYDYEGAPEVKTLDTNEYGGGTPTVELDDVYNKIRISCNLYDVEDVIDEVIDDDNKTIENGLKKTTDGKQLYSDYVFSWREWNHHTRDENIYTMLVKPYYFNGTGRWKSTFYHISNNTLSTQSIDDIMKNDCIKYQSNGSYLFTPQYISAYPLKQFIYNKKEGMDNRTKINWDNYIMFPIVDKAHEEEHMTRERKPVLTFTSDENLTYTTPTGTGYLVFNADMWLQAQVGISGPDQEVIWTGGKDTNNNDHTIILPCVMQDMGFGIDVDADFLKREKNTYINEHGFIHVEPTPNYNNGFRVLPYTLQIGDKYWDSANRVWTTTFTKSYFCYHDDDVATETETLSYFKWSKVARNPNVSPLSVGEDGYAIPITKDDELNGKLTFTLYTPNAFFEGEGRLINAYYLKDMKLKYVYKDSHHWADDVITDNDIVYENIIDEDYSTDMDEMELKINSWYKDKPISKSYMLDSQKAPVMTINDEVQEVRLLEKYYDHYSTPKKIFNINYHELNVNPLQRYYHTPTRTTYAVDSYKENVRMRETELKLIEI